jgi:PAS domain S-box-containing protein
VNTGNQPRLRIEAVLLEESAEELYEHAPCGYLSTLPDGSIVKVNQTFLDWTGTERGALLAGTKFQALLTIGSRVYYETHYAPLLRMQGRVNELAIEIRRQDGRTVPVLMNARQKCDDRGSPLFHRIMLFDATDRRRYERELLLARRKAERIAKDRADLITMLSHDIRNPLNAVMTIVQMLERSELAEQPRSLIGLLRSSSDNMIALLDHVLELSRIESDSFTLGEGPIAVRALVDEVTAAFEPVAREKGVAIGSVIAADVPDQVIADPIALRQVLTNLVANAVKFTAAGAVSVVVEAHEVATDAATLLVAVTDTGIGIEPDAIARIFDPFAQASPDTPARYGGTGLGLTITRRLLALYGSTVEVQSTPGTGSTFSFRLRLPLPPRARM